MNSITAKIIYQDKRTLQKSEVTTACIDEKHAMQIAKKLRPRYAKLVSVVLSIAIQLPQKTT